MNKTRNSLGGKNKGGRTTGARSSRASSTIFKKLRKLDRKITEIDNYLRHAFWRADIEKLKKLRKNLDEQRKQTRALRKSKKI